MAEKLEAADPKPEKKTATGGGLASKVPLLLAGLNTLLLAGVLLVTLRGSGAQAKAVSAAPVAPAEHAEEARVGEHGKEAKDGEKAGGTGIGPTVRLPDFIVHLRDSESDRYARLSFEIEVREEKGKEAITARLPQIRDAFLSYLSDRTVEELRGSEAMAQMKDALTKRLHDLAPGAPVKALYVTDIVVQ